MLEWGEMERESTTKQKWGESLISHFLAENIDRIMLNSDFFGRQMASEPFANLMLASLCNKCLPVEIFEHIKIDFTHPKTKREMPKYEDPELRNIEAMFMEEFGSEVMKRTILSFSEEKTHSLTHQDCI